MKVGVSQGIVLGPFYSLIYTSVHLFPTSSDSIYWIFADDFAVMIIGHDPLEASQKL